MPSFVIIPIITANWAAIAGAITGSAAAMGFAASRKTTGQKSEGTKRKVEIQMENTEATEQLLQSKEEMRFQKNNITLIFRKDVRGRYSVCAEGENCSQEQLQQIGQKFANSIVQRYVYNRVVEELQNKGFNIANEETTEQQTIKIVARKWS